jgi:hypothetical protein
MQLYSNYSELPFYVINSDNIKRKGGESYGLAVLCNTTGRQVLVRPIESYAFLLFFRGVFHLSKVRQLVSQLTEAEHSELISCLSNRELFEQIYKRLHTDANKEVMTYAYTRLTDAKEIIEACPVPTKQVNEFAYCRGQRKGNESGLECAYREFYEETGVDLESIPHKLTKRDQTSFSRTGSGLSYLSKIYIIEVEEEFPFSSEYDKREVLQVAWLPFGDNK